MTMWRLGSGLALFAIVAFWGATFELIQRATMAFPVLAFLAWRFTIATVALLAFTLRTRLDRRSLFVGALIGVVLAVAYVFQTFSLQLTDSTQTGMITGLFIVFVPIFGWILFGIRASSRVWFGMALSLLGLYLLVRPGDEGINQGSVLAFLCAASFGLHVALVDRVANRSSIVNLTVGQLAAAAFVFWTCWGVTNISRQEIGPFLPTVDGWIAIVATGLIGSSLGFAVQAFSQRHLSAMEAGIIIMTEPVFAAIVGWLYGERLTGIQWLGAALMVGTTAWLALSGVGELLDGDNGDFRAISKPDAEMNEVPDTLS